MTPFLVFVFILIVVFALLGRAKEVKREMIEEALDGGDEEEAENIENMSDEEIIDNYEDRF